MTGTLKGLGSRAIIGAFFKRLEEVQQRSWVGKLASVFKTDQEIETYDFTSDSPTLKEVGSNPTKKGLKPFELTLKNKKYQSILDIDDDDMRRDKTDQIMARVNERAGRAAQLPQQVLSALINANGLAYDKINFFHATNHKNENGDVIANAVAAAAVAPTNPTADEVVKAVLASIQQILSFKDDEGEPRNEDANEFLVMCPINMLASMLAAVRNDFSAVGATNTLKNSDFKIEVVPNVRLTANTKFSTWRMDSDVKGLLWQDEVPTQFSERNPSNSDKGFEHDVHLFKAKRICAGGYGRFDQAVQTTFQ